ncbi:hypothetical protein RI129_009536 [Pyrocoelia pectoralis]|uniref:Helix-turn-helix domain-containing protein n=1 Tax=Pyrocoelia pectoralis TaxID=417401 RepID=A0AAN7V716_9COLE
MEVEKDKKLSFLDILVYKKINGTLGHTVYRKSTHTNRYLNSKSHHHPAQLQSVVKTLITRSKRLTDEDNMHQETVNIRTALLQNEFSKTNISRAEKPTQRKDDDTSIPIAKSCLPYVRGMTDRIGESFEDITSKPSSQPTKS